MASMAFLLLGAAASLVASVDPTLQLEALTQKARRMQELTLVPLPAACASACPDFQSAYDEMECLASKGAEEYLKETLGLFCSHKSAFTCAATQSACGSLLGDTQDLAGSLDCFCGCPNSGKMYADFVTALVIAIQQMNGQTIDEAAFYTAACPMTGPLKCIESSSLCTSYLQTSQGASMTGFENYEAECTSRGYALDYTQNYTYTPPQCGNEASAASGLVGLNLLFLTFSLLCVSIHE